MLTTQQQEYLRLIREHLATLHTEWENDPIADGHHKSSEGTVEIHFIYPNWFEANDYLKDEPEVSVSVYSYLFGPNRMHDFDTLEEAWETVKEWEYKKALEEI